MEILNQADGIYTAVQPVFSGRNVRCDFDSCDLHDCYEQQNERIAGSI